MATSISRDIWVGHEVDRVLLGDALQMLAGAYQYAIDTDSDVWEFAVELEELRRLHVSKSDLRWLLIRNYVLHRQEVSPADGKRRFRDLKATIFPDGACFVITQAGLEFLGPVKELSSSSASIQHCRAPHVQLWHTHVRESAPFDTLGSRTPFWNRVRNELLFDGKLVKKFRCPAPNQLVILDKFQSTSWPQRIDDPLPSAGEICPKRRLHDAIKALNRNQAQSLVHFAGDGSARGVLWEEAV